MAQDAPYFPRAATEDQDLGGINQNFRDLSDRGKDLVGGSDVPGNKCFGTDALCYNDALSRAEVGPNGVCFADGTCQTTAPVAGVGNSTVTYVQAGLTGHAATQNPNVCITGSTATVTCNTDCRLMAHYQTSHQAGATNLYVNLLFDGDFAPYIASGSNTAPCAAADTTGTTTVALTCSILGPAMPAGEHNVCVAIGLSSGGANPNRAGQLSVVPVK